MGGVDCIRELLEIDPQVKAIVMSGYAEEGVLAEYVSYGFKAALPKPFTVEEISAALQTSIGKEPDRYA